MICGKCKTRYALAYSSLCQRCRDEITESKSSSTSGMIEGALIGYAVGTLLSDVFGSDSSSSSSDYSSSSSDWSGGGGDTGGGGASGDW
jgi:uncharacterized membrane protein YgcG